MLAKGRLGRETKKNQASKTIFRFFLAVKLFFCCLFDLNSEKEGLVGKGTKTRQ